MFKTQLGTEMRAACSPNKDGWDSVPDHEKAIDMFIINYRDALVRKGLDVLLQEMYRKWKGRCSEKYKECGNNPTAARQAPVPSCCPESDKWIAYIEHRSGEKQHAMSMRNSQNRRANPYPTCQGRNSLAQLRMAGVTVSTQGPTISAPAAYKKCKTRRDGTWAHPVFEQNFIRMEEGLTTKLQQISQVSTSDPSSSARLTPQDEIDVMQRVLNRPRRGFIVGIGTRLPGQSRDAAKYRDSSTEASSSRQPMITVEEHNRELNQMRDQQKAQFNYLVEYMRQLNPNAPPILEDQLAQLFPTRPHPPQQGDSNDAEGDSNGVDDMSHA